MDLPQEMQRAIAAAGRSRTRAPGEDHSRRRRIPGIRETRRSRRRHGAEPVTITLRYLQTLVEIGTEKNTTGFFPVPVELLSVLMGKSARPGEAGGRAKITPGSACANLRVAPWTQGGPSWQRRSEVMKKESIPPGT